MKTVFSPHRKRAARTPPPDPALLDSAVFARTRLGLDLDPIQCGILTATSRRVLLNCTRQWGKTTVSAAKAIHRAFTRPESQIVVASPGLRQSGEWMKRAAQMLNRLGIRKKGDGYNRLSLLLPNDSRIVGIPDAEDKVRGFSSLSMLIIDEAARVSEEMYASVLPMLITTEGDLWMVSTPWGKRGFFYEEWEHGGAGWHRIRVTAPECPRIRPGALEEQRNRITSDAFLQEYMCDFIGSGIGGFDRDLIEAALDDDLDPI
jgi:hypothetical protein